MKLDKVKRLIDTNHVQYSAWFVMQKYIFCECFVKK